MLSRFLILSLSIFFINIVSSEARVLDKTLVSFNDEFISLSQVERITKTLATRSEISPLLYPKEEYQQLKDSESIRKKILEQMVQSKIIRRKLSELGFVVSDEQVEPHIKETEVRLGMKSRAQFIKFIEENKIQFKEYFEIIRESIEFNLFMMRIIVPLTTISDQDLRAEYLRRNSQKNSINFRYDLTLYNFALKGPQSAEAKKKIVAALEDYQRTKILPSELSGLDSTELNNMGEDGLQKEFIEEIIKTNVGSVTSPICNNNKCRAFLVKSKSEGDSDQFQKQKEMLRAELTRTEAQKILGPWFKREGAKYYIHYSS